MDRVTSTVDDIVPIIMASKMISELVGKGERATGSFATGVDFEIDSIKTIVKF